MESVAYTAEDQKSASLIQAFVRRDRRRAGGTIAAAFDDLVKRLNGAAEADRPGKDLLLCLRGPLPHVLAYLKVLHEACQAKVGSLTKEMKTEDHEMLDELREKKDELRYERWDSLGWEAIGLSALSLRSSIHREVKDVIKDILPSSEFYCQGPDKTLVSVLDIVERVRQIPRFVSKIREVIDCPENTDYELGVEPLLSNRVPWALKTSNHEDDA